MDGNEAVAHVAYRINEVISIYPITPSSTMAEYCDEWAASGKLNLWGVVPTVIEMQSEGGAAGTAHGALQTGSFTTTFTASQGLLLMIPNMFKIAGELTPAVFHVSARALAYHALSIFGDHSDVMACRTTGFGMLASNSGQEAMDFALISQAISLESRIPFLHFFDGFRTSHEVTKVKLIEDEVLRGLVTPELTAQARSRALTPDHPVLRGTAQNPDVYFQGREKANPYYLAVPGMAQKAMDKFAKLTGRAYKIFEYVGAPDAERVIIMMGSGAEAAHDTADHLLAKGEKVGLLKVRLYRPFDAQAFVSALPTTTKTIAVLDRTKESGSLGEPLYLDVVTALSEMITAGKAPLKAMPRIIGGRYGLSSKEFTPAMVVALYNHMKESALKNHFTLGINDDVTHTSLPYDEKLSIEPAEVKRALFFGLGADGTVGANKNTIKIIGENTDFWTQGYFVYDSKKSGSMTTSHVRFGPKPIRSTYLINHADFVACHQPSFLNRMDMLKDLMEGGTFLLNTQYPADQVWETLPQKVQESLLAKKAKLYVIDASTVAKKAGMGSRINTIMQACYFALSGVLPREEAIAAIKKSIVKTYKRKGDKIVQANLDAVDTTLANLHEVSLAGKKAGIIPFRKAVPDNAPAFVKNVLGAIIRGEGDMIPVSAFPEDGTYPTATALFEKRDIALEIPVWNESLCIQCGKCVVVCPHAVIRPKVYEPSLLNSAPQGFKTAVAKHRDWKGMNYTLQVAPEDCTGCGLCVEACPVKSKTDASVKAINMKPQLPLVEAEIKNWVFFLTLPEADRSKINLGMISQQQLQQPLFEFSGACGGCGETPYVKMVSQLFGDRMLVANATGCSSIYGGNLPTTPWAKNAKGQGPAWSNSLFEDNAEFGLGYRVSLDHQNKTALSLLSRLEAEIGKDLVGSITAAVQKTDADIEAQRARVTQLKDKLKGISKPEAKELMSLADSLVKKSVWIMGGDGWAYDIGYGGLDHVLSTGRNINILVLDTEVYSNTGGQASKSTPKGAVAKFAAAGKPQGKKDLGLMAMTYGNVYVARVALGANDGQVLKALQEAEAYDGPSIVIAYSHCIAHGYDLINGLKQQKSAVDSGQWVLYRYHPDRLKAGENPLTVDSGAMKMSVQDYEMQENRFKMLTLSKPEEAKKYFEQAQSEAQYRWNYYQYLSKLDPKSFAAGIAAVAQAAPTAPPEKA
jgi:pyruvate-ferredoxin/flavodoxin oxidoreductase